MSTNNLSEIIAEFEMKVRQYTGRHVIGITLPVDLQLPLIASIPGFDMGHVTQTIGTPESVHQCMFRGIKIDFEGEL